MFNNIINYGDLMIYNSSLRRFVIGTLFLFVGVLLYKYPDNLVYSDDVITLLQDGLYKVIAGLTSTEEVIKLVEADDELNAATKLKHTLEDTLQSTINNSLQNKGNQY